MAIAAPRWRADCQENGVRPGNGGFQIRGEAKPPGSDIFGNKLIQPRFIDRHAPFMQRGDLGAVEQALRAFAPDVLSLQMVCYGFADHGVLVDGARRFARLARLAPLRQLMMHELWIGEFAGDRLRSFDQSLPPAASAGEAR